MFLRGVYMNNQYPIGQYEVPTNISNSDVSMWIADITSFPDQLKSILQNISDDQLHTTAL